MAHKPLHILLVDDDEVDAELVIRGFRRHQIGNPITHTRDGIEALQVLRGTDGTTKVPQPYIILLDINMPRMNGFEFLKVIRNDADLRRSVVFMLTTSNRDEDKLAAYNQQIAGYLVKEKAGEHFLALIQLLGQYQVIVELPE